MQLLDRGRRTIVIGDFVGSTQAPVNIQQRLYDDLEARLKEKRIVGVKVKMDPETIRTEDEAKNAARRHEATAVIWGFSDQAGATFRVFVQEPHSHLTAVRTEHAPWIIAAVENQVESRGPDEMKQAAFIAMYVAGQLLYLDNRYAEGAAAFDEAIQLAAGLELKNRELIPFFEARAAHMALPPPVRDQHNEDEPFGTIACNYAKAIELQPRMYQAYANLGVLLAPRRDTGGIYEQLPAKVQQCFSRAGLRASADPGWMFDKARTLRPNLTAIDYNSLSTEWSGMMEAHFSPDYLKDFEKRVRALLARDDTLTGAHLMLGVLAFKRGDMDEAARRFERVLELNPGFAHVHTDLGQARWGQGDVKGAEAEFAAELEQRPDDRIAAASFAVLAIRRGDVEAARKAVLRLTEGHRPDNPGLETLWLVRAWSQLLAGDHTATFEILSALKNAKEQSADFDLLRLMIALVHEASGNTTAAAKELAGGVMFPVPDKAEPEWGRGYALYMGWSAIGSNCSNPRPTTIGQIRERCLKKGSAAEQLQAIFNIVGEHAKYDLHHQYFVYPDLNCPYVYVRQGLGWQFVSAVLIGHEGAGRDATDRRELPLPFSGVLKIAERERETTYLDSVWVEYERAGGVVDMHAAADTRLRHQDGRRLILNRGDEVTLQFPPPPNDTHRASIVAAGFYVASPPPPRDR